MSTGFADERMVLSLTGMMGVGKSRVGQALAKRLGWTFVDLDARIAKSAGTDIPTLLASEGEAAFREREQDAVAALARADDPRSAVVATGGWTVGNPQNLARLSALGPLVCLRASPATIAARLGERAARERPLLAGPGPLDGRVAALLDQRWPVYGAIPYQVATDGRDVDAVVAHVIALLSAVAGSPTPRSVAVRAKGARYSLLVGDGLLGHLGALMGAIGLDGRTVLISDTQVGELYGDRVAAALAEGGIRALSAAEIARVRAERRPNAGVPTEVPVSGFGLRTTPHGPAVLEMGRGEHAKSPETVVALWQALAAAGLDRRASVVGLGGGVVTDTAGFAAAGLLRGIRWAAAPTTLLAMVDAGIGGKTGVNLEAGKNLAGAFWQPSLVVADPTTLATLEPAILREGLAEIVKAAVIGDIGLLADLERDGVPGPQGWSSLVARSAEVKATIVGEDALEAEGGRRVLLNLGHTFAHAIERVSDYGIRHGAAVAIGLVAAARLAEAIGVAEEPLSGRLSDLLRRLGLPTHGAIAGSSAHPDASAEALLAAMAHDKKRADDGLRFVLPVAAGDVRVFADAPKSHVLEVLRTIDDPG